MDTIYGDDGNDTIFAGNLPFSKDIVDCGDGDSDEALVDPLDSVSAGCETTLVGYHGDSGSEAFDGGAGDDRMWGHGGNDTINGLPGADEIYGGRGTDNLNGGEGKDLLFGYGGKDRLSGGGGDDDVDAEEQSDTPGEDNVAGNVGNDTIFAQDGFKDAINCGDGEDKVYFDIGLDTIAANCETLNPPEPTYPEATTGEVETDFFWRPKHVGTYETLRGCNRAGKWHFWVFWGNYSQWRCVPLVYTNSRDMDWKLYMYYS